ncbi:hypothetical protein IV203_033241 [Nitzschia inconspicua]|uniref:Uncharacterized protein n=1 Tax=Nitzschia inconspicua TaxID=303405 RepID=A0A9K3KL61_9STRA|nr:hypothetical protein IV203_033241 [Nitzschia inconspicua]
MKKSKLYLLVDGHNCWPIACLKVWKTFLPWEIAPERLRPDDYRPTLVTKFHDLVKRCSKEIIWEPGANRKAIAPDVQYAYNEATDGDMQIHESQEDSMVDEVTNEATKREGGPKTLSLVEGSRELRESQEVSIVDEVTGDDPMHCYLTTNPPAKNKPVLGRWREDGIEGEPRATTSNGNGGGTTLEEEIEEKPARPIV